MSAKMTSPSKPDGDTLFRCPTCNVVTSVPNWFVWQDGRPHHICTKEGQISLLPAEPV